MCCETIYMRQGVKVFLHIISLKNFHKISGAPPETLPNVEYYAHIEVCADKKNYIALLRNVALNQCLRLVSPLYKKKIKKMWHVTCDT